MHRFAAARIVQKSDEAARLTSYRKLARNLPLLPASAVGHPARWTAAFLLPYGTAQMFPRLTPLLGNYGHFLAFAIPRELVYSKPARKSERNHQRRSSLKILLVLPIKVYEGFVNACSPNSGQYQTLKNAVILDDAQHGKSAGVLCEPIHARVLLGLAQAIYPEAAPYIEESIRLGRQP